MHTFLGTSARKFGASAAATALILGSMISAVSPAAADGDADFAVATSSLADALNSVTYQYPDLPPAVNGVNVGQPGQNFRDHWIDCDRIAQTATFNVPPPIGVTTMRSDLLNFTNCTVVTSPNVNPTDAGNAKRRTIGTNGQVAYTNTTTGKTLTVIYAAVPAATSTLSSGSTRGVVGQALTPVKLTAVNFTPTGFSVDPALPDGLSIDPATGEISGTPTAPSQGQYAITASDGTNQGTGVLTIEVSATPAYVVTFNQEVGINPYAASVTPGQSTLLPTTNSVKDNSVFAGWRTAPSGGGDLIGLSGSSYMPTSSLTLYADWKPRVRITFQRASSSDPHPIFPPELQPWVNSSSNLVLDFEQGSVITLPVPTRANAGFRGWYNTSSCPTGSQSSLFIGPGGAEVLAPSASTATWRACWETSNLTVSFNPRSGTFTGSDVSCTGTASCNRTWTVGEPLAPSGRPQVTAPTPNRSGYVFNGWYTATTGGTRVAGAGEPLGVDRSEPTSSRTYNAQWTPLITFDPGEGQEVNDDRCLRDPSTPRLCLIEWTVSNLVLPAPTSAAGLLPTGWFQGSTRQGSPGVNWSQSPYGGAKLTARWFDPSSPAQPKPPRPLPADDTALIVDEDGNTSQVSITRPSRPNNQPPSEIKVERTQGQGPPDLSMSLEGVNRRGEPVELSPDGLLVLSKDRQVAANGTGFLPDAPVGFYLTPPDEQAVAAVRTRRLVPASTDAVLVATVTVDENGDFDDTLVLPDGLTSGDYLLEAVGPTSTGETLSIILGVRVEVAAIETPDPATPAGPPVSIQATAGDASARVTWSPPATTGDFPVTTYQVVGSPGGGCLVQAPARSCVISGLTNGVDYTFIVRALTGAGWSPYSEASAPVTPQAQPEEPAVPTPEPQTPTAPVGPGDSIATENGQPVPVTVDTNERGTGLSIVGDGFDMNLEGVDAQGTPIGLSADGVLLLTEDRRVAAQGNGFAPGAPIAFYLYPPATDVAVANAQRGSLRASGEPILLDTVTVDNSGGFTSTLILPPGMTSGDYLVQAVGEAMSGVIRSVTLGVRVETDPSILITGSRAEVRGRPGVQVTGVTTGLNGASVMPRVRLAKEETYSDGVGLRVVADDGSFEWERVTSRWIYVYFRVDDVRSNRIVLRNN